MPEIETMSFSKQQDWVFSTLKEWLLWKGLHQYCAPTLLLELAREAHLNPHTATNVIGTVEKYFASQPRQWRCSTKAPEQYKGQLLKGLWKSHLPLQDLSTMVRNLTNEMNQPWVDRKLEEIVGADNEHPLSEEQCGQIASMAVVSALRNRSKRASMTGHWLVFSRVKERNYYLTLARHDEPDEGIFERARIAANYYPEWNFLG